jgi:hypothetical protein
VKAWDIVGFTADADIWCCGCAVATYGQAVYGDVPVPDGEGNAVWPVFASDECYGRPEARCGSCHGSLV